MGCTFGTSSAKTKKVMNGFKRGSPSVANVDEEKVAESLRCLDDGVRGERLRELVDALMPPVAERTKSSGLLCKYTSSSNLPVCSEDLWLLVRRVSHDAVRVRN